MVLKAERERVKALLTEAITVLCKNGLGYKYTCAIEGLLGITLDDDDVFLVNINESIQKAERPPPVEETTKQETGTHSPASSSPSNTPRRRRRRSQEGEGGQSPAKRANYGAEQDHSRIKPQSREDVIVIKEEVSETEFSDFYGDTGGGENEDSGQYVMQQGDQQYPGAGCSQWDTSQTQGGQSDWPAFNPTQQQQAAISQAASSAMMSPSQVVVGGGEEAGATAPCSSLNQPSARTALLQHVIQPAIMENRSVVAVRMTWPKDDTMRHTMWEQIVPIRAELDTLAMSLPNCQYFISAITAVKQSDKASRQNKIWPAIGYWAVLREPVDDCKIVINTFSRNPCGAAVRLMLQPYQKSEKELSSVLFNMVKDNVRGCVPRMVQASLAAQKRTDGRPAAWESAVRLCVVDKAELAWAQQTASALQEARFFTELIEMVVEGEENL